MLKLCLYVTSVSSCLTFSLYNINIILVRNRTGSISVFMQQCLLIFFLGMFDTGVGFVYINNLSYNHLKNYCATLLCLFCCSFQ